MSNRSKMLFPLLLALVLIFTSAMALAAEDPFGPYEETVEFTVSRYVQTNTNLPEGDTYEDNAYTRYMNKKLNVLMKSGFEAPGGDDYDRQVALTLASGDLPDMMTITDYSIFVEMVEAGMVADLSEAYENYASDGLRARYDSFGDRALGKATIDDKLYALPNAMGDGAPCIVWVREDWVEALEMDVDADGDMIITLSELEDIIRTFMEKDPGGTGNPVGVCMDKYYIANNYGGAHNALPILSVYNAFPSLWIEKDGAVTYGSIEPETKQALAKLNEWYTEGLLDPEVGTRTWEDINALLINNQMGVCFGAWHISDWMLTGVRETNPEAMFMPLVIADDAGHVNAFHTNASNNFVVVREGFEYPELAVKIANIFYDELAGKVEDPDILNYQAIGVDNSTKPFFVEIGYSDGLVKEYEQIRAVVLEDAPLDTIIATGNQTIAELCKAFIEDPATTDVTAWARYHSRMRGIEIIKQMYDGDYFNWTDPVFWGTTQTMLDRMTNLNTLQDEAFIKIITGEEPIDSFDTFVETWRAEGGDMIIAEVQAEVAQ